MDNTRKLFCVANKPERMEKLYYGLHFTTPWAKFSNSVLPFPTNQVLSKGFDDACLDALEREICRTNKEIAPQSIDKSDHGIVVENTGVPFPHVIFPEALRPQGFGTIFPPRIGRLVRCGCPSYGGGAFLHLWT